VDYWILKAICSSNIAIVVAINLFASFFVSVLYIHYWLLLSIALFIDFALSTIAIVVALSRCHNSWKSENYMGKIQKEAMNQCRKQHHIKSNNYIVSDRKKFNIAIAIL
jgi:hypothetical protein